MSLYHGDHESGDEGNGKFPSIVRCEQVWWTELVWHLAQVLPDSENDYQSEANNQRCNHSWIRAWRVRSVDDAHKNQAHSGNDEYHTDIIQAFDSVLPRYAFRMFWWLVEQVQRDEAEELSCKSNVVNVSPLTSCTVYRVAANYRSDHHDNEDKS